MYRDFLFIINIFKSFVDLSIFGLILGFIGLLMAYLLDTTDLREEGNRRFSTTVGNVFMVFHHIFESGRPKTEQVIWIKKKRTPVEKKMRGLHESFYDTICIKGYQRIYNKRYVKKLG